jgi:hypothetical protein
MTVIPHPFASSAVEKPFSDNRFSTSFETNGAGETAR